MVLINVQMNRNIYKQNKFYKNMKNKKGLSAIVATLLIILLAIIAFAIVATIVQNTAKKTAEKIELNQKCLDVVIHATEVVHHEGTTFNVTLSRSLGGDTINGVGIILTNSDGDTIRGELEGKIEPFKIKTEPISFEGGNELFVPVKVTVIPYFLTEAGEKFPCEGIEFSRNL